jgi:hypothetical protein
MAEYRISVYGRKQSEWDQLASWFVNNGLYSKNAVWLIQVVCCSGCYSCSISLFFSHVFDLFLSSGLIFLLRIVYTGYVWIDGKHCLSNDTNHHFHIEVLKEFTLASIVVLALGPVCLKL